MSCEIALGVLGMKYWFEKYISKTLSIYKREVEEQHPFMMLEEGQND